MRGCVWGGRCGNAVLRHFPQILGVGGVGFLVQVLVMIEIRKAEARDIPDVAAVFIASQADALPYVAKLHTPEETFRFIDGQRVRASLRGVGGDGGGAHHRHDGDQPLTHRSPVPAAGPTTGRGIGTMLLNHAKQLQAGGAVALRVPGKRARPHVLSGTTVSGSSSAATARTTRRARPDILFEWHPEVAH
jgi:hypothetical protein